MLWIAPGNTSLNRKMSTGVVEEMQEAGKHEGAGLQVGQPRLISQPCPREASHMPREGADGGTLAGNSLSHVPPPRLRHTLSAFIS